MPNRPIFRYPTVCVDQADVDEVKWKGEEHGSSSWNRWMRVKKEFGLEPPDSMWQPTARGGVGLSIGE